MRIERTGSRKTCSGTSETASGSRSSDSIRREACGSASATASAKASRSSSMAGTCSEIPATTIRSRGPSREPSRSVRGPRDVDEALSLCRSAGHLGPEQKRQGRQPEDLKDQGDDRRQGGNRAKDRERQDDRQAEILERRERGHGHTIRPGDAERPREQEHDPAQQEGPSERKEGQGRNELGMSQQGSARGAGRRHDQKEERDAHGTAAELDRPGEPPEESGSDERDSDQQDRLQDELPERRRLAREHEGDRRHETEAEHIQERQGDHGPPGVSF